MISVCRPKENMLNLNVEAINNNVRNLDHHNIMQNQYVHNIVVGTERAVYDQNVRKNWERQGYRSSRSISQKINIIKTYGSSGFQKLAKSRGLIWGDKLWKN